jgi:hypothetical protein
MDEERKTDYAALPLAQLLARVANALWTGAKEDCDCAEYRDEDPGYTCGACLCYEAGAGIEAWQRAHPDAVKEGN